MFHFEDKNEKTISPKVHEQSGSSSLCPSLFFRYWYKQCCPILGFWNYFPHMLWLKQHCVLFLYACIPNRKICNKYFRYKCVYRYTPQINIHVWRESKHSCREGKVCAPLNVFIYFLHVNHVCLLFWLSWRSDSIIWLMIIYAESQRVHILFPCYFPIVLEH